MNQAEQRIAEAGEHRDAATSAPASANPAKGETPSLEAMRQEAFAELYERLLDAASAAKATQAAEEDTSEEQNKMTSPID